MASKPKPDPALKDIKIKTGVVKRLAKERDMYIKEANTQEAKIQKMKDEGQDEYNIKKQNEVLHETRTMIPDIERKLTAAYEELSQLLSTDSAVVTGSEEFRIATELLQTVKL